MLGPKNWTLSGVHSFYQETKKECIFMKGYVVDAGYMGYVEGRYILFANEEDYREYFEG